ncbi:hypothetical protein [Streptomyces sp. NPDC020681]|uniref:hypothetical protein n=1 Tax=Streptomyces sp. NPDC020681 TaxID=3365083 RepID=UPI003797728D
MGTFYSDQISSELRKTRDRQGRFQLRNRATQQCITMYVLGGTGNRVLKTKNCHDGFADTYIDGVGNS